jgi:hypothetical protein
LSWTRRSGERCNPYRISILDRKGDIVKKIAILAAAASILGGTVSADAAPLTVSVTRNASATISLSSNAFQWGNVTDNATQYLASDGGAITVTGSIATSSTDGSGSISVQAPANLVGSASSSDVLPISNLSVTCSGSGNTGTNAAPAYAAQQALTASGSTACATWGAGANVNVDFSLAMFLDDRTVPVDTYTSSGFAVVASAQ